MQPITKASDTMPVATTTQAGREVLTPAAEKILNDRELARKRAARSADALNAPQDAPLFAEPTPAMPTIEIQTTVQHRGRSFTVVANGLTLDQFCDILDKRGYAAEAQTQEWQTLPDGTPICPKHHTPMRKRERQGDTWYSHSAGK